ncbi:alpha/beta fold hydrolase [Candidatus Margulisiibacteriota bacterium]
MFLEISPEKKIYYESTGQGKPLIFVPGWTMDHQVFNKQREYFASKYNVILFDPPGCGNSDRFDKYSFSLSREVIRKLVDKTCVEDSHLVGWSMGGEILLSLLAKQDINPRSLTLLCSTPCFVERGDWSHGMPKTVAKKFSKGLKKKPQETFALFREEALRTYKTNDLEAVLVRAGQNTDLLCAEQMFHELENNDLREGLSEIDTSTYIISGVRDQVCLPEASIYMAENIKKAKYASVGRGHVPFIDEPALFNQKLEEFLKQSDK